MRTAALGQLQRKDRDCSSYSRDLRDPPPSAEQRDDRRDARDTQTPPASDPCAKTRLKVLAPVLTTIEEVERVTALIGGFTRSARRYASLPRPAPPRPSPALALYEVLLSDERNERMAARKVSNALRSRGSG